MKGMKKKTRMIVLLGALAVSATAGLVGARVLIDRDASLARGAGAAVLNRDARMAAVDRNAGTAVVNHEVAPRRLGVARRRTTPVQPAAAGKPTPERRERERKKEVKRLLEITQRLVRAREELLLQKQRMESAEIEARRARAEASRVKFEAMRDMFRKNPKLALGDKGASAATDEREPRRNDSFATPPPWSEGAGRSGPRVKAAWDIAARRSALVEYEGRDFLVLEGSRVGRYRVSRITGEGVYFTVGKRRFFSPLSAAFTASSPASASLMPSPCSGPSRNREARR